MSRQKYIFGELEQAIMDIVWTLPSVTVRDVVQALHHRAVAYTTVMTVMNRLAQQQILVRQQNGNGAFDYRSRQTREEFGAAASRAAIEDLVDRYGAVAMAQFVDRLDRVPSSKLSELRRQLKRRNGR